jgi:hypothetical protein
MKKMVCKFCFAGFKYMITCYLGWFDTVFSYLKD